MSEVREALARFFEAFERGTSKGRLGFYADALEKIDQPETVVAMLERVVTTWDKGSPPPLAVLLAELGQKPPAREVEVNPDDAKRARERRYHLERYSDPDQHLFFATYGERPSLALFAREGIAVPEGVTFRAIPEAECRRIRAEVAAKMREALGRADAARKL